MFSNVNCTGWGVSELAGMMNRRVWKRETRWVWDNQTGEQI